MVQGNDPAERLRLGVALGQRLTPFTGPLPAANIKWRPLVLEQNWPERLSERRNAGGDSRLRAGPPLRYAIQSPRATQNIERQLTEQRPGFIRLVAVERILQADTSVRRSSTYFRQPIISKPSPGLIESNHSL